MQSHWEQQIAVVRLSYEKQTNNPSPKITKMKMKQKINRKHTIGNQKNKIRKLGATQWGIRLNLFVHKETELLGFK